MEIENENNNDRIGLRVTAFSAMGECEIFDCLQDSLAKTQKFNNFLSFFGLLGSRKYMEDTFSVAYQKSDDGKDLDYSFFGMFDG
jgi:hypothetical protein